MKKLILSFILTIVSLSVFSQNLITVTATEKRNFFSNDSVDYKFTMSNSFLDTEFQVTNCEFVIDVINKTVFVKTPQESSVKKMLSFSENKGEIKVVYQSNFTDDPNRLVKVTLLINEKQKTVIKTYFNKRENYTVVTSFTKNSIEVIK